ncbi:MAG: hypothetical protein ICV74_03340 [Thermoleophilia bacterium]|nr:hypothetical protein [Thermoleophilia bacterium]
MPPRRTAWLVCLALMAVGSIVAHVAAYRVVAPHSAEHEHLMQVTGHGYLQHVRFCLAVCAAVALLGLGAAVFDRVRGRRALHAPLWVFAVVPPLGFVVQEHVERLFHAGGLPYAAALEATFVLGLALQLPFALVAFFAARLLLAAATALVDRLRTALRSRLAPAPFPCALAFRSVLPACVLASFGHGQRAPPAFAAA